jgi:hypothetical protein
MLGRQRRRGAGVAAEVQDTSARPLSHIETRDVANIPYETRDVTQMFDGAGANNNDAGPPRGTGVTALLRV